MPLSPVLVSPVLAVAALAAVFSLKHYVADFLLQTNWVAQGKEARHGWGPALLAHVAGHAVLTLAIVLAYRPALFWLALVDFAVHIAIDRAKTGLCHRLDVGPSDVRFWWVLGLDQLLHQLTNVALALALVAL